MFVSVQYIITRSAYFAAQYLTALVTHSICWHLCHAVSDHFCYHLCRSISHNTCTVYYLMAFVQCSDWSHLSSTSLDDTFAVLYLVKRLIYGFAGLKCHNRPWGHNCPKCHLQQYTMYWHLFRTVPHSIQFHSSHAVSGGIFDVHYLIIYTPYTTKWHIWRSEPYRICAIHYLIA